MKANEITLALLKASKVISLENGNVVEYIKPSTYNETAYNNAIVRGEDIVLFKTSESDNKARAIVSVNGVESSYPLYINEIKKFAETGIAPTEKTNYFVAGSTKKPRQISEGVANKRNLRPISEFSSKAAFEFAAAELVHYKEYLKKVHGYETKYNITEEADDAFNVCSIVVFKEVNERKTAHALKRWEQYQKARNNKLEFLKNEAERAQKELGEFTAAHVLELAKRDILKKVQELGRVANKAEENLQSEQNRVFLTAEDVAKMYGI